MATIDEIFATMPEEVSVEIINDVLTIDPNTRKITVPESETIFGVEYDNAAERKYFQCPRFVGNDVDLFDCVVQVNYKNANDERDIYVVTDLAVVGDNVVFSWELSEKVVRYKGRVQFVVCASMGGKPHWHTTLAIGNVLEGMEPNVTGVEEHTTDVVAQLVKMVEAQTKAVQSEGITQVIAVQDAAEAATAAATAEIEAKKETVLAEIPDDYTALSGTVNDLVRNTAGAIVCLASGESIVVDDASNNYLQGLHVFGKSTQDGTPTPEAPVEIKSVESPVVMVAGKNLLPTNDSIELIPGGSNYVPIVSIPIYLTGGTYTFSFDITQGGASCSRNTPQFTNTETLDVYYGTVATNDNLSAGRHRYVINIPKGTYNVLWWCNKLETSQTVSNMQLELGSVETKYEQYKSAKNIELTYTLPGIPVTTGGNYTDSNGQQWICDEVDFARGVYVQRTASVVCSKTVVHDTDTLSATVALTGTAIAPLIGETVGVGLCNVTDKYAYNRKDEAHIYIQNTAAWVFVPVDYDYINNPPVVLAALSAPIEIPLSATELAAYAALRSNKPTTTILNDSGAYMTAEYVADTKLYIDNKIAALAAQA